MACCRCDCLLSGSLLDDLLHCVVVCNVHEWLLYVLLGCFFALLPSEESALWHLATATYFVFLPAEVSMYHLAVAMYFLFYLLLLGNGVQVAENLPCHFKGGL